MSDFPYHIPARRSLTTEEREIIRILVAQTAPERLAEIDELEVHGRCGCGKCPTIMFRGAPDEKKEGQGIVADYQGGDDTVGRVGIILWERDGELSELEAWSIGGREVVGWPTLDSIRPFGPAASK